MKRHHQNARKTFRTAIAGMFLLFLFATPALVRAQHFQMTPMNSAPRYSPPPQAPSRPTPAVSRSEPSESMPAARQTEESRPTTGMNNSYELPRNEVPKPNGPSPSAAKTPTAGKAVRSQPLQNAKETNSRIREKVYSSRAAANGTADYRKAQSARVVETRFPDGTRLVSTGRNQGFVEHPIASRPGYVARTFVAGGRHYCTGVSEVRFPWVRLLRFRARRILPPAFLSVGSESLAGTHIFLMGLERSALVRILRCLLHSGTTVRHFSLVADRLLASARPTARL
jgi:hypothetical protein